MPSAGPGSRSDRTELPPQLFPCGCPYPTAFRAGEVPVSPRRRMRWTQFGPTEWRTCRVVRLR
eukprot:3630961-Amphidinium_carterae.1